METIIIIGIVAGIFGLICFQFLCRGATERVVVDYEAQQEKTGSRFNYFKSIGAFFTNKAAVSFTIVSMLQLLVMAFMQNISGLYIQITFPGLSRFGGIVQMLSMLPMVAVIPFAGKIVKKFGKKEASTWPTLLGVLAGILLLLIPTEKLSPVAGLILWLVPGLFMGLAISVNSLVGWAMVADCIDYQEVRTGVREEGVVYATYSLGRKISQGLGASLISFLLIATGYIASNGATQAPEVSGNMRILLGAAYVITFALQFVLLHFVYNLDKAKVAEIEKTLGRSNTSFEAPEGME